MLLRQATVSCNELHCTPEIYIFWWFHASCAGIVFIIPRYGYQGKRTKSSNQYSGYRNRKMAWWMGIDESCKGGKRRPTKKMEMEPHPLPGDRILSQSIDLFSQSSSSLVPDLCDTHCWNLKCIDWKIWSAVSLNRSLQLQVTGILVFEAAWWVRGRETWGWVSWHRVRLGQMK